jgi:hypothetical protein
LRKRHTVFLFIYRFFLFSSLAYLGAALISFIVLGALEKEIFGIRVSFTSLVNPIRISFGLVLLGFLCKALASRQGIFTLKDLRKNPSSFIQKGGQEADCPGPGSGHRPWIEAFCLGIAFCGLFFFLRQYTADVAGFADTYGYVSEAVRLSQGRLYEPEQVYSGFGLPEEAERSHPLGYIEKGSQGTVPIYPFGYPLIMAAFIKPFGLQGAFWVTPFLAAGTVLLTS